MGHLTEHHDPGEKTHSSVQIVTKSQIGGVHMFIIGYKGAEPTAKMTQQSIIPS